MKSVKPINRTCQASKYINSFTQMGGVICTPLQEFKDKTEQVRGLLFDWDGVLSPGKKGESQGGLFSEVDAMGINMLRYMYWRLHRRLPHVVIISGSEDRTAFQFAGREHFNALYTQVVDKKSALDHVCRSAGISLEQIACFFDDINDLAMASHCGIKLQIRQSASPLFSEYTIKKGICDYISAHSAAEQGVRECCEFIMGLNGDYSGIVESRVNFDRDYRDYWTARNRLNTIYYTCQEGGIVETDG